jgi:hypothetical protein
LALPLDSIIKNNSTQRIAKLAIVAAFAASVTVVAIAIAQTNVNPPWAAFTSGGGHATSQNYEVTGVIGQPIVGHSESENFQADAGLLGEFAFSILCVYDTNSNGAIEKSEAVDSVTDYLLELTDIVKSEAVDVVTAYLLSKQFIC